MFHVLPLITKFVIIFLLGMSFSACTYYQEKDDQKKNYKTDQPYIKVFYGSYEKVWLAVSKAVGNYKTTVMDKESGYVQTVQKALDSGWRSPHVDRVAPSGRKYRLVLRVLRGEKNGRKAVSVSVKKVISNRKDFFSVDEEEPSDGLEEQSILYRVQREYRLDRGLEKYYQQKQKSSDDSF